MMRSDRSSTQKLADAAQHLRLALALLDEVGAPGEIGANVDLAANQVEALLPELIPEAGRNIADADADPDAIRTFH